MMCISNVYTCNMKRCEKSETDSLWLENLVMNPRNTSVDCRATESLCTHLLQRSCSFNAQHAQLWAAVLLKWRTEARACNTDGLYHLQHLRCHKVKCHLLQRLTYWYTDIQSVGQLLMWNESSQADETCFTTSKRRVSPLLLSYFWACLPLCCGHTFPSAAGVFQTCWRDPSTSPWTIWWWVSSAETQRSP